MQVQINTDHNVEGHEALTAHVNDVARLQGRQPIAVTHHAATLHLAIEGAADKLARMVENTVGRLRDQRNRTIAEP